MQEQQNNADKTAWSKYHNICKVKEQELTEWTPLLSDREPKTGLNGHNSETMYSKMPSQLSP